MLRQHLVLLFISLVAFSACGPERNTFYGAVSTFSVWSVQLDNKGSGSVAVSYVNPGSPQIHRISLDIQDARPGSSAKILKGGTECGEMNVQFEQHNKILVLGEGSDAHVFSLTDAAGIHRVAFGGTASDRC